MLLCYKLTTPPTAHIEDLEATIASELSQHIESHVFPKILSCLAPSSSYPLQVKDTIVIKYDASSVESPGQPLHADKSTVSVNIALTNPDEFLGGGTFFPDLLSSEMGPVVKPAALGDGIVHFSSRRHAGVSLKSGVRAILVIFIDQVKSPSLQALDLQAKASRARSSDPSFAIDLLSRSIYLQPSGAAALHLRSTCHILMGSVSSALSDCRSAASLSPHDARYRNDLGVVLQASGDEAGAREAWRESIRLFDEYSKFGCIPSVEAINARLNLAVSISYLDDYKGAAKIMKKAKELISESPLDVTDKMKGDVNSLLAFCVKKMANE